MTIRFWISSSVSEIFAAELQSRPKSGSILHVLGPWNFFGVHPPKFWTNIIKFGLVLTIVQNFTPVGPRISEISRAEKKHQGQNLSPLRKLSLSGGLISNTNLQACWNMKDTSTPNNSQQPYSSRQSSISLVHSKGCNVRMSFVLIKNLLID